jgi:hypothetical protein
MQAVQNGPFCRSVVARKDLIWYSAECVRGRGVEGQGAVHGRREGNTLLNRNISPVSGRHHEWRQNNSQNSPRLSKLTSASVRSKRSFARSHSHVTAAWPCARAIEAHALPAETAKKARKACE